MDQFLHYKNKFLNKTEDDVLKWSKYLTNASINTNIFINTDYSVYSDLLAILFFFLTMFCVLEC